MHAPQVQHACAVEWCQVRPPAAAMMSAASSCTRLSELRAGMGEGTPVQPAVQTGLRAAMGEPSTAREQLHTEAEAAAHVGLPGAARRCPACAVVPAWGIPCAGTHRAALQLRAVALRS